MSEGRESAIQRLDHLAEANARASARAAAVTQRRRLRAADEREPGARR